MTTATPALSSDSRLGKPALSSLSEKSHADVTGWLKQGDCVILHLSGQSARVYHRCLTDSQGKSKEVSWDELRVICVDTGPSYCDLLNPDQWPKKLTDAGCKTCSCSLKDRVVKITTIETTLGGIGKYRLEEAGVNKKIPHLHHFRFPV